jgi:hypothetical protein
MAKFARDNIGSAGWDRLGDRRHHLLCRAQPAAGVLLVRLGDGPVRG